MTTTAPRPWYKQFWPWFIVTIPSVSIILSSTMLYLALSGEDSMVVDDYYKKGRAINIRLAAIERARELGLTTEVSSNGTQFVLSFTGNQPEDGTALELFFQHPTLEGNDFTVMLTRDGQGDYRAELPKALSGDWKLNLHPLDRRWKVQQAVNFSSEQPITFNP